MGDFRRDGRGVKGLKKELMAPTALKCCSRCGVEKPADAANFDSYTSRGKKLQRLFCRECFNARTRAYRAANPEKAKEWDRRNWEKNREQKRQYKKRKWAEGDKRANVERVKEWRRQNPEKEHAMWKRTYEKHKHKHTARTTRWAKENPEARAAIRDRRRAREVGASGDYTKDDVRALLKVYGRACFYCSTSLTKFHVDHFIPLARGGSNAPDNLRLSCPSCNFSKGARMPWEWKPERFSNPICEAA